jgi:intracellular sulfur oxidation DsrE/DsrF family protein
MIRQKERKVLESGNTVPALQQRGVVFMGCHNAIWKHTAKLLEKCINSDRRSHEAIAAELTNHLIEGVVLTPSMVGTIPELQQAGVSLAVEPNHEANNRRRRRIRRR